MSKVLQPVVLHCHSRHSFLDGMSSVQEMVSRAKELGMDAIALTNHGNIYGWVEFYKECQKQDIKPIIGMEAYLTPDHQEKARRAYHLVLLAENQDGVDNLIRLTTRANENFYYKPRIDFNDLREFKSGLIALTACLHGPVTYQLFDKMTWPEKGEESQLKEAANVPKAYEYAQVLLDIFGPQHLFLEVQDGGIDEQKIVNPRIRKLASDIGVQTVATQDFHYVYKKDALPHTFLKAMAFGKTAIEEGSHGFSTDEFYIKSREEWLEGSSLLPEEVDRTRQVAARCNAKLNLHQMRLPQYPHTDNQSSIELLKSKLRKGWQWRQIKDPKGEYAARVQHELNDVETAGLADYFLIVSDITDYCRANDVMMGPSRGSAGGSLISYLLGITGIDPIRYGLIWERFYNAGRVGSMPDIDTDVEKSRRDEVIAYIRKRFGERRVAQIVTLSSLGAKQVLRDVLKVVGVDENTKNLIAGLVPAKNEDHGSISLKEAIDTVPKLKEYAENDEKFDLFKNGKLIRTTSWKELFDIAQRLEGCYKTAGVHAGAVVIADDDFSNVGIPLVKGARKAELVCGWDMDAIDTLGFLKVDILGIATLDVIKTAQRLIKKRHNIEFDLENLPLDDKKVFDLLSNGYNQGIFQLESHLGKTWSKKCQPRSVEEIAELISVIRPATLDTGLAQLYVNRKLGKEAITYIHPKLEPILKNTHGTLIYQEQMMAIASQICGWDLKECDVLRKVIGKKKPEELRQFEHKFIADATKSVGGKVAGELWSWIEKAGGYGFNACVSGDTTIVRAGRNDGCDREITISELWEYFHGSKKRTSAGKKYRNQTHPQMGLRILSMKDGRIKFDRIKDVYKTGYKTTYKLSLSSGHSIRATLDHRFYTSHGWKTLEQLKVDDKVIVSNYQYEPNYRLNSRNKRFDKGYKTFEARIVSIDDPLTEITYDIEMCGEEHNFLANGIVTHNSHALGYAILAYWTAWIKTNFYIEFLCANLMHAKDKAGQQRTPQDVISQFINDGKLKNVDVVAPQLGRGDVDFSILDDHTISYGFGHIKGVGAAALKPTKACQGATSFTEFLNLASRHKMNKQIIEAFICTGMLDHFNLPRRLMKAQYHLFSSLTAKESESLHHYPGTLLEQITAMADEDTVKERKANKIKVPNVTRRAKLRELVQGFQNSPQRDTVVQMLAWEKQYLGVTLSGSMADLERAMSGARNTCKEIGSNKVGNGQFVDLCVVVEGIRETTVKRGKTQGRQMAFFSLSDSSYTLDGACAFPDLYDKIKLECIEVGDVVSVSGRTSDRGLVINKMRLV